MDDEGVTSTLTAPPEVESAAIARGARTAAKTAKTASPQEPLTSQSNLMPPADDGPPPTDTPLSKEGVVARLFEAFSRRELLSALPFVHPEVIFQPMTAEVTRAGEPYVGHEGMRRYTEDLEAHWHELTVHPAQIRAAGRAVVVLGLASGSGPAGSFENAPTTWVIKFRDGLVYGVQIFSDARNVVDALVGDDGA
jgi:ketosteroid isomerase-like protein